MASSARPEFTAPPDLTICEREPIHIPGSVEPNGALLVVQEPELTIVQASANCSQFLGVEASGLLGTQLVDVFVNETFQFLHQRVLP